MTRFTLYINFKEKIIERPLPAENDRTVFMDFSDVIDDCVVKFEVFDNIWTIYSDHFESMSCDAEKCRSHMLADRDIIKLRTFNGVNFVIMVYAINPFITEFEKYSLRDRNVLKLGSSENQDIIADSPYISAEHAVLTREGDQWFLSDTSLNGTYLNGEKIIGKYALSAGDVIYTVGLKLVFLGEEIAANRSDIVKCCLSNDLFPPETTDFYSPAEEHLFSRSPRTVEPLFDNVIEIEAPPNPQRSKSQPLLFVVGPSVTMPIPILLSTFINSQMGTGSQSYLGIVTSVGMSAFVGASWALAHYVYNKKTARRDEEFRVSAYREYISKNEKLLRDKQNYNSSVLVTQYLSSTDIAKRFFNDSSFVWNRNIRHSDFLHVRLGTGNVDFSKNVAVPKQRFSLYKDEMAELPQALFEKYCYVHDAVVTVDLMKNGILGMIGNMQIIRDTLTNILVQTAVLHCYTDVRMAMFITEKEYAVYHWVRWLPHFMSEDMKLRLFADESASYQNVLYHIDEILRQRAEKLEEDHSGDDLFLPHYVVFCTDYTIFENDGILKYIPLAESLGFTFVLAYGKMDRLTNECKSVIQCDEEFTGFYNLENKRGETDRVNPDRISLSDAERLAKGLGNLRVREFAAGEIPNSIEYFNMIGIGRLDQWDLIKKYKENRAFEGIRSFVGVGNGGKPVYIDIHEKKYGPHGLVAGTTGSGKSETLQTFIISLALNYHPNEVAFILIDYKGGGMAYAFEGMPHIAGMITNLGGTGEDGEIDAGLTRRALISIRSEIKYRQSVFNRYRVNHIDTYIKLYREGVAAEPLPHLIIISDEFAELKKEQPDFIKELVSTARVGRSLGIHLILATQKPGGVVDEEIRSNSRFKLCLRVQDKQDSMEMLRRPDAAYLTQTGRAYLQIGNDEIFEQFQTGYSGADYILRDDVTGASESDLYMMNIDGTAAVSAGDGIRAKSDITQLKAAVEYIIDVCAKNRIQATRGLWLPELPSVILPDECGEPKKSGTDRIYAIVGMIDDPEHQRRLPAVMEISECSNMIITGMAGFGKTTLVQTMLVSLIGRYTPEQLNFYLLDFSSRTMKLFTKAAHCGLAAFSDDNESVTRLFKFLSAKTEERRDLFNRENVGSFSEYIRKRQLPLIVVVIDNFYSFTELYPELQDGFGRITRDCSKYGIQIIITCNTLGDVKYKLRQNFSGIFTLVMPEKSDYREAWGVSPEFLPKNSKGRGLISLDGRLLEFQAALPCAGETESDRNEEITEIIARRNEDFEGMSAAESIRTLPTEQEYAQFHAQYMKAGFLPIGYRIEDISPYGLNLSETFCYSVSGAETRSISAVLENTAEAVSQSGKLLYFVKLGDEIRLKIPSSAQMVRNRDSLIEMLVALKEEFHKRAVEKKTFLEENPDGDYAKHLCAKFPAIFILIDSMNEFLRLIYTPAQEDLHTITEEYFKKGKGMGIYFIAGFEPSVYGSNYMQSACRLFVEQKQGIHLGGRYDRQKLFSVAMPPSQAAKAEEFNIGMIQQDGKESKIWIPVGKKTQG